MRETIRRAWHRYGVWVLLSVMGLMCFGAGVQLQTHTKVQECRAGIADRVEAELGP